MPDEGEARNGDVRSRILFLAVHRYGLGEEEAASIVEGCRLPDGTVAAEEALAEVRRRGAPPRVLGPVRPGGSRLRDEEVLLLRLLLHERRPLPEIRTRLRAMGPGSPRWELITRRLRE